MSGIGSYNGKKINSTGVSNVGNIEFNNNFIYQGTAANTSGVVESDNVEVDLNLYMETTESPEKYANAVAPEYETVGSILLDLLSDIGQGLACVGATIANFGVSLLEGLAELAEGLFDGALMIQGILATPIFLLHDGINFIGSQLCGYEFEMSTTAYWTDTLMPLIGTDLSGQAFDALYSTEVMTAVNNTAWAPFQRGGIGYDIGKTVGYTIGTITLGIATAGIGFAPTASVASTAIAGISKAGSKAESGYNKLSEEEKGDIVPVVKVVLNGSLHGMLEAVTWNLTYGNGMAKLKKELPSLLHFDFKLPTNISNSVSNTITTFLDTKFFQVKNELLKKVFPNAIKGESIFKAGIQYFKSLAGYGIDLGTTGSSKSLGDVMIEGLINSAVAITYDASGLKNIVEKLGAKVSSGLTHKTYNIEGTAQTDQAAKDIFKSAGNTQVYKSLSEAISKTQYHASDLQAHLTRLIFEGAKKTGGTFVKKFFTEPLKQLMIS